MRSPNRPGVAALRLTPLAACVGVVLGIASCAALAATTWTVDTCDDNNSGSTTTHQGSLRFTTAHAASGDTIELTTLPSSCDSTLTLKTGAIPISVADLTLLGPKSIATIDGNGGSTNDRVLKHTGTGSLNLDFLTIEDGGYTGTQAFGGCVYSTGSIYLLSSTVSGCTAATNGSGDSIALGGGIYARHSLSMLNSVVSGNTVKTAGSQQYALGGGIYTHSLTAKYSSINGNYAQTSSADNHTSAEGGGAFVYGDVYFLGSTIASNSVSYAQSPAGGGLLAFGASKTVTILNSTFSGNRSGIGSAMFVEMPVSLYNTTIAFNVARNGGIAVAGGLYSRDADVTTQSSIFADNIADDSDGEDLWVRTATISGANNLIIQSNTTLPTGTIMTDPQLAPLAKHGGLTLVHALLPGSPAIAQGSNAKHLENDQRGNGFPRENAGTTDIGAYERQSDDDEIFYNGFEPPGG